MLLPLAFVVAAVIGFLDEAFPNFSAREFRAAGLTAGLVNVVAQSSGDARRGRWILLIIGIVLMLYAAHGLYRALYMTHLVAWEMPPLPAKARPMVLASVFLVLLPVVGGVGSLARNAAGALVLVAVAAGIALYSSAWLGISWLLPHRADRWTGLVPGAVLFGTGMTVLQLIALFVVPGGTHGMSRLYGSLAIASSTIAWLFIFGRLAVGAATLNATLWDRRGR